MEHTTMLVVAAGNSTRMGYDKQRILLDGVPVVFRTLHVLQQVEEIDEIILITRPENIDEWTEEAHRRGITKLTAVVTGGDTRQQSTANGMKAVSPETTLVGVHDGARPLVSVEDVSRVIRVAAQTGCASLAIPVYDTVKRTDENNLVTETLNREHLWRTLTPQVLRKEPFIAALEKSVKAGISYTDECQSMEREGYPVTLVEGSPANMKLTAPSDVDLAKALLHLHQKGATDMRIGHGYDVHRLTPDRPLILGGITIPYPQGLLGHSDADVLTHAIMDALLGAAGLGDIGGMFPDTDPAYAGADSICLLGQVIARIAEKGYAVVNVDATVLAQQPKLKPFIPSMRERIATACNIPADQVSVKATTEEGLGFTGTMEGIAAHAVCLLQKI